MWPPRTLVVTDRSRLAKPLHADSAHPDLEPLVAFVGACAQAGVDAVQVRERDWPDRRLADAVRAMRVTLQGTNCRLLVNERLHVALAAGADGVHLRSDAMPVARVRAVAPHGVLVGRSVHADDIAAGSGADYMLFGTVFPSVSKGPSAPVAGLDALAACVAAAGGVPVVAIGGIEGTRVSLVRETGACGVAAIDLFATAYANGPAALADVVGAVHAMFSDREQSR